MIDGEDKRGAEGAAFVKLRFSPSIGIVAPIPRRASIIRLKNDDRFSRQFSEFGNKSVNLLVQDIQNSFIKFQKCY